MAVQVTGYFKNPETEAIFKDPLLLIQFYGLPKGKLAVDVNIVVNKEQRGAFPFEISVEDLDDTKVTTSSVYGELLRRIQDKLIEHIPSTNEENSTITLNVI